MLGFIFFGLAVAATDEGHGYARLIVDDTEKARQLIEDANELVAATEVLLVRADRTTIASVRRCSVRHRFAFAPRIARRRPSTMLRESP